MIRGIWKIIIPLLVALIAVIGLFILLERPPRASELDPGEMVRRGGKAFKDYEVKGKLRVTVYRDGKVVKSEVFPSPVEARMRQNGRERGRFFPEGKMPAHRFLSEMSNRFDVDEEFLAHHSVELIGPAKIAGRWAWEMEIRPDVPDAGYMLVSLDAENGFPLKREKFNYDGEKENSFEYIKISGYEKRSHFPPAFMPPPPPGPPPPGDFRDPGFMPPDEFKKLLSEGSIPYPTRIPPGYSFKGARAFPPGPIGRFERIQLIFSDGLNAVSIFMIHLPPDMPDEEHSEAYIKQKLQELH
jgi:hypothetical protein